MPRCAGPTKMHATSASTPAGSGSSAAAPAAGWPPGWPCWPGTAEIPLAFQVLSYPMLDDRLATRSGRAGAPLWGPSANQFGWRSYLSSLRLEQDIPGYAVPARAADLAGLPPAFITVGNLDGLLDEDVDYARRLIAAGVPTDLHVFADGTHAFDSQLPGTAIAQRANRVLEDWLQSRLHPTAE